MVLSLIIKGRGLFQERELIRSINPITFDNRPNPARRKPFHQRITFGVKLGAEIG
jgi:hypothetical protein